ncbi:hypothetical protein QVD17_37924 [Tagetes erecta]|uniref:Uncharacterized protein n=1 Tax=Tagetes erecta TaxID=13708 RepID=A0AAD8NK94_TARER|nr:hypothetical protein QVD17_37924 [Tagetes erecta]
MTLVVDDRSRALSIALRLLLLRSAAVAPFRWFLVLFLRRVEKDDSVKEVRVENSLECGRTCNAKAATVVGEVLAMRLKVEGLESGRERGIHVDVEKELEKKDFKNRTKVWAVINSLKNNGVKLVLDENNDASHPVVASTSSTNKEVIMGPSLTAELFTSKKDDGKTMDSFILEIRE